MQQQAVAVDQPKSSAFVDQIPAQHLSERNVKPLRLKVSKTETIGPMNKRHKRLLSVVAQTLMEFGSLDARKAAVVALAKEAKVNKAQLKTFIELACEKYPEINQVMRVTKKIRTLKASGKTPNMAMFNYLQPDVKRAGKDDFWLSEQLGFIPSNLKQALLDAETKNTKKSFFGSIKGLAF